MILYRYIDEFWVDVQWGEDYSMRYYQDGKHVPIHVSNVTLADYSCDNRDVIRKFWKMWTGNDI
jgi:hypothetical protein